jgi:lysozyme
LEDGGINNWNVDVNYRIPVNACGSVADSIKRKLIVDYTILPRGADLSHYQGVPDFKQLVVGGVGFVILKATQGMSVDPDFFSNANAAADAGLITFAYPFVAATDDETVIQHFLDITDGMVPALDVEIQGIPGSVVDLWMDGYETKSGRQGLYYHGIYPVTPVTPRQATWPWWIAEYAPQPKAPAWDGVSVPDWTKEWLLWQYSGNGRAPGITTAVDLNRCAVPLATLKAWHDTGSFMVSV